MLLGTNNHTIQSSISNGRISQEPIQHHALYAAGKKKQVLQQTAADYTEAVTNGNVGIQTITNADISANRCPQKQCMAEKKTEIKGKNDTDANEAESTSSIQVKDIS